MDWNERVAARSGLHIELVYRRLPTPQKASENCGWMAKEPRGTTFSGRHAAKSVWTRSRKAGAMRVGQLAKSASTCVNQPVSRMRPMIHHSVFGDDASRQLDSCTGVDVGAREQRKQVRVGADDHVRI